MAKCCDTVSKLKHRVTLQTASKSPDGQGGFVESWADVAELWVGIEPIKGWERYQAMQTQTPVTHKIVARYRSDITTTDRLKYGTRIFEIKEVLNRNEDSRFLDIKAIEQV